MTYEELCTTYRAAAKRLLTATLNADREIVSAARAIKDAGENITPALTDRYAAAQAAENEAYSALAAHGLDRAMWAEYDRSRSAIYKGIA